ncbi:hypothetical protein [Thauera linaloolentis]|uniref:Uncharacterized protein n=1 Tax=Thauera linaloolentis (strain DSM 12138 / JCM 21573 / CCUG 41526 / CIP 105981 / IAM 15112 / NBRC 102519 / 47Lol) TaxID=1123367 RepID=N6Y174_THAL4|nr:hypothetical protein [Thauera linaloolentis]ENO87891.1 hypothetical protein C666_09990 [Thauera linaloolentis 47Lol = DSM 12138]MCM8567575.1 hypothetical protein [Thauera linaloolentis]
MNIVHTLAAWSMAAALAGLAAPAAAGPGHDHGDAPAALAGPALPRFAAASELFELVGVIDGRHLTVYLDRFADNSPVHGATLELDIGGTPVPLEARADGTFEAMLAEPPAPGVLPVTVMVLAGDEADLLAGELDVHDDTDAHAQEPAADMTRYAGWLVAGLLALGGAGRAVLRKGGTRGHSAGGVA